MYSSVYRMEDRGGGEDSKLKFVERIFNPPWNFRYLTRDACFDLCLSASFSSNVENSSNRLLVSGIRKNILSVLK